MNRWDRMYSNAMDWCVAKSIEVNSTFYRRYSGRACCFCHMIEKVVRSGGRKSARFVTVDIYPQGVYNVGRSER